jgi:type I restriction enzyme M protein
MEARKEKGKYAPLQLYGQEFTPETWAMANMNMVIHDMECKIEIGDTMKNPKFKEGNKLEKFDLVITNPMWNQDTFEKKDYENDEFDRFKAGFHLRIKLTGVGRNTSLQA